MITAPAAINAGLPNLGVGVMALQKINVGSALPQAEAEHPPRAQGPWSDVP